MKCVILENLSTITKIESLPFLNLGKPKTKSIEISTQGALGTGKGVYDGDQGITSKDLVQIPIGPVTRARAKKFKDVLNGLIQELWAQANSWRPIEHDPRKQQKIVNLIQVLEGSGQD